MSDSETKLRLMSQESKVRTIRFEGLLQFAMVEVQVNNERDWKCQVGNMLITGDTVDTKFILETILDAILDDLHVAQKAIESLT